MTPEFELRPWSDEDLPLLFRTVGDAEMMKHLGGPETAEKIARRHQTFLDVDSTGKGAMYTIRIGDGSTAAGSIGFWESEWAGELVYETGWMVLPEFSRQGLASVAARAVIDVARAAGLHRYLHAFPSIDNVPSNRVCLKAGFVHQGEYDDEYPPGRKTRVNDWRVDLHAAAETSG